MLEAMPSRLGLPLLLLLLLLFVPIQASSDVIILKSQKYHKGKVLSQNSDTMVVREATGRVVSIPKRSIRRVLYLPEEEMQKLEEVALRESRARAEAETKRRARLAREEQERRDREERTRAALLSAERRQREQRDRQRSHAEDLERSARFSAMWRSALLPGWGQAHRGRPELGAGIVAAWVGGLVLWRHFDVLHSRAVVRLENATTLALLGYDTPLVAFVGSREATDASRDANRHGMRAQRVSFTLLCVYVVSVAQAWTGRAPVDRQTGWDFPTDGRLEAAGQTGRGGPWWLHGLPAFQFRYTLAL